MSASAAPATRATSSIPRTLRRLAPALVLCALAGCKAPDLKPDFLKRGKAPEREVVAADPSLTPRELITARLVNARTEDAAVPGMTVGKLIEFADRYLACDCSATRFAKAWRRIDGGYELETNAGQAKPLRFLCGGAAESMACYLTEIDRGAGAGALSERFMPGSDFVQFIYTNGLKCERTEPCPTAAVPAQE